jgi:hypothetical protein
LPPEGPRAESCAGIGRPPRSALPDLVLGSDGTATTARGTRREGSRELRNARISAVSTAPVGVCVGDDDVRDEGLAPRGGLDIGDQALPD